MAVSGPVRHRTTLLLAGAAVCALAVAGCGSSTPNAPSTTAAMTSAMTSAGTSTGAPGSAGAGKSTTLTGTIEAGVENGCFVLVDDSGAVLANLVDVDTVTAPAGSKVEVTGTFQDDLMTICQQGKPFAITAITIS